MTPATHHATHTAQAPSADLASVATPKLGICVYCGESFDINPRAEKHEHCSDKCRMADWDKKHPRKKLKRSEGLGFDDKAGASDEWYTPPDIFSALGERFDLDPCSPGSAHWVPADKVLTKEEDGLTSEWHGFVFMNPPFGGRNGHVPWLRKFMKHGNGIAIVRAYTSSAWFHEYAIKADAMLFPRGKTKFIRDDGSIGKAPGHGIVLLAMGERAKIALKLSGLGLYVELP